VSMFVSVCEPVLGLCVYVFLTVACECELVCEHVQVFVYHEPCVHVCAVSMCTWGAVL
jgi:hypothetical protein